MRRALAAALVFAAAPLGGGEIPGALLVLEVAPGSPGSDPSGAPPRFVLLRDGQVFVGGSSRVESGRLEKREAQALEKRAAALRRIPGLGSPIALGGASGPTMRLRLADDTLLIEASGDPAAAPPPLAPLGTLLAELLRFHHPSLRPYTPQSYAIVVREGRLVGGCRPWSFPFPVAEAIAGPRSLPAAEASGWPTGAMPASVCVDDRRYVVTLRPLLPGEQP